MKTKSIFLILIIFIVLSACKKYDINGKEIKYNELFKANWLVGNWEKTDSIGTLVEHWEIENDSTYIGTSYFIIKKDTIHSENIELIQDKNHLIYNETVIGENNDESIPFQMIKSTDSMLVFENPKHDYPKKIVYKLTGEKRMTIKVSGIIDKKKSSENYQLAKIN